MKQFIWILGLSACVAAGSPLEHKHVAADAKWLLHIDFDVFRASRLGSFFAEQVIAREAPEIRAQFKFDLPAFFQKVQSATVYGTDYGSAPEGNGVAIVRAAAEARKIVEGALSAQALSNTNGPIRQLETRPAPLYSIQNEIFISTHGTEFVLIAKSRAQVEKARRLLDGKAESLAASSAIFGFPEVANSFFFLAVAEGFAESAPIPPQARILQMTEGGRVVLGEKSENVWAQLSLRGRTTEVTRQIQQVVEGILALVTLSQGGNEDLAQLIRSAKVSGTEKMVNIQVEYPLSALIAKLSEKTAKKRARADFE